MSFAQHDVKKFKNYNYTLKILISSRLAHSIDFFFLLDHASKKIELGHNLNHHVKIKKK